MAVPTHLQASRVSRSTLDPRTLVLLVIALLLVPIGQLELFAQQAPYYGQYAPYQPSGYVQPQPYAQPSPQPYTQPYPQQSYPISAQPYQQQPYTPQQQSAAQPLNAQQLEQLVAPIALYPDILIAQVLTASTYPLQVVDADRWRQAQGASAPEQIAAGANAQPWDPSIKALTAFPQVLSQLDQNIQWTTQLGNAYYNQPQETFAVIQIMRQRAQQAGTLQNTPQQTVSYDQGNIQLAPANQQMVYVPSYNPWTSYGQPVTPYPGFSLLDTLGSVLGSSPIKFGLGIAMSAFTRMPWGWLGWGLSWLAHEIFFQQSSYSTQSSTVADWGLPYGGPRAFYPQRGFATQPTGYYRTAASYPAQRTAYNTEGFVRTPSSHPYGGNRPQDPYNRGYQAPTTYARPPQETYNHIPASPIRSPQDARSGYGSSRPGESYGTRPGTPYSNPTQPYRPPVANPPRDYSNLRFPSSNFEKSSPKPPHSSGFHLFGGDHAPKQKNFSSSKSFSSHSGGGGHSSGHSNGSKHHLL